MPSKLPPSTEEYFKVRQALTGLRDDSKQISERNPLRTRRCTRTPPPNPRNKL